MYTHIHIYMWQYGCELHEDLIDNQIMHPKDNFQFFSMNSLMYTEFYELLNVHRVHSVITISCNKATFIILLI